MSTNGCTMGWTIGSTGVPVGGSGGTGPLGGGAVVVVVELEPPEPDPPPPVVVVVDPGRPDDGLVPVEPGPRAGPAAGGARPLAAAKTKSTGARSRATVRFVTMPEAAVTSWS